MKRLESNEDGLTLVEILIAVTISAIVGTVMAGAMYNASKVLNGSTDRSTVAAGSTNLRELLKRDMANSSAGSTGAACMSGASGATNLTTASTTTTGTVSYLISASGSTWNVVREWCPSAGTKKATTLISAKSSAPTITCTAACAVVTVRVPNSGKTVVVEAARKTY